MKYFTTSGPDTVVGLEPGTSKEQVELITASACDPVAHHTICGAARSSSIGLCHYVCGFVIHILVGIKILDLYICRKLS